MKKLFILLFSLLLLAGSAFAAGSEYVTIFEYGKIQFIVWTWTCDASGDVNGNDKVAVKSGTFYNLQTDPESGVTNAYDVTIQLEYSIPTSASAARTVEWTDITGGDGTDLSNSTNGSSATLSTPFSHPGGLLQLTVANAGNAQSGTIILLNWLE